MAARLNNFDLRLLTASKDVGLRRLRSYAAALGGGAQIFHAFEDLHLSLERGAGDPRRIIVLHDSTLVLSATQLNALAKRARLFIVEPPDAAGRDAQDFPPASATCWTSESYLRCSLNAFLDSPVLRMSMAHLCKDGAAPFHLEHLLRWGHSAQTWHGDAGGQRDVEDASVAFTRSLSLVGESRRLTEMFSHFLATRVESLGLRPDVVTFGSDGLLTLVVARCTPLPGMETRETATELAVHQFPYAVVNRRADGTVEIGALHHPAQDPALARERVVFTINQLASAQALKATRPEAEESDADAKLTSVKKAG